MKQIAAGEFKIHYLAVIDEVQATGESVLVTKHGRPVVKLVPAKASEEGIFGYMAGKGKIVGDIISPVTPIKDLSQRSC